MLGRTPRAPLAASLGQADYAQLLSFAIAGDCADIAWSPDDSALLLWERPARSSRLLWYSLRGELLCLSGQIRWSP